MPSFAIQSAATPKSGAEGLCKKLSSTLASSLGKPESYVLVTFQKVDGMWDSGVFARGSSVGQSRRRRGHVCVGQSRRRRGNMCVGQSRRRRGNMCIALIRRLRRCFGGSTDPAAFCYLSSLGSITPEKNTATSAAVAAVLAEELDVPQNRYCAAPRGETRRSGARESLWRASR